LNPPFASIPDDITASATHFSVTASRLKNPIYPTLIPPAHDHADPREAAGDLVAAATCSSISLRPWRLVERMSMRLPATSQETLITMSSVNRNQRLC
jgi:hypothetical protein